MINICDIARTSVNDSILLRWKFLFSTDQQGHTKWGSPRTTHRACFPVPVPFLWKRNKTFRTLQATGSKIRQIQNGAPVICIVIKWSWLYTWLEWPVHIVILFAECYLSRLRSFQRHAVSRMQVTVNFVVTYHPNYTVCSVYAYMYRSLFQPP